MDLSFLPLTLDALDAAAAESLCLFVASDERPLQGLSGLLDWRLSGKLSRLLRGGLLTGEAGEAVLTPPGPRLGFQKMFLFGVGPSAQGDAELAAHVTEALRKLFHAGVHEAALQLPTRLSPEVGVQAIIDQLQGPGRALVFGPDPQKLVAALALKARGGVTSQPPPAGAPRMTPPSVKPLAPGEERRPTPPPPQRYVPAEPKQNVFQKKPKK